MPCLPELSRHRKVAAVLCVALAAVVVWQVPRLIDGASGSTSRTSASPSGVGLGAATTAPSTTPDLPAASAVPTASPSARQSVAATARPAATPIPSSTDHPWQPDPVLIAAKIDGRVTLDAGGGVVILDQALPTPDYPPANALDTRWSGLIQEPPRTGQDDQGHAYTDYNYSLFCGAGTAAVVLYYWPASRSEVTGKSGTFVEPVELGTDREASTYWKAEDAAGYGRGMILYLAEVEWPVPDRHLSWWSQPGLMNWSASPPSTNVQNLVDALNWEASGRSSVSYFYVVVFASQLTAAALLDHVHADINMGVPVVIAARTSDGTNSLPYWNVKSTRSAVNHFVTVVGYDDAAGTYAVMDTCGTTCNDKNARAGVANISQSALFSLIVAESDDDGIMW
jgi:hypothetical protein